MTGFFGSPPPPRTFAWQIASPTKRPSPHCCALPTEQGVSAIVFPELCLTGLYLRRSLPRYDAVASGGTRASGTHRGKRFVPSSGRCGPSPPRLARRFTMWPPYSAGGKLLGLTAKSHIPNYSEFYEARHYFRPHRTRLSRSHSVGRRPCSGVNGFILARMRRSSPWAWRSARTSGSRSHPPAAWPNVGRRCS